MLSTVEKEIWLLSVAAMIACCCPILRFLLLMLDYCDYNQCSVDR